MSTALLEHPGNVQTTVTGRKVLLISYHFPPVGGAGVQRPVKFVKYLPEFGWDATVLMAANPSVPVRDESLCRDLPADLRVIKARTLEPGYAVKKHLAAAGTNSQPSRFSLKGVLRGWVRKLAGMLLQPDPQILWLPAALKAARKLLRAEHYDAIVATAPPYSNLLLGTLLKRQFKLPLIVDYRDEWDLSSEYLENSQKDFLSRVVQPRMQRWVLRNADAIVATTEASTCRLRLRASQAGSRAVAECIYNGYDESDFITNDQHETSPRRHERFTFVYTGTLWNLTSVAPVVEAVERLSQSHPQLAGKLELVFVGRKTPAQRELLNRLSQTPCLLRDADYCDHHQAVELMQSADALCLLLSDLPGADRVAPAKLFEYLATGRPILAVTPKGETTDLVRAFQPEGHFHPEDTAGIAQWLEHRLTAWTPGDAVTRAPLAAGVARFSRRNLAGRLAEILDRVSHC